MRELVLSLTKKDFTVQVFRAGGKGGQHQNKTSSGVRIIHSDSGAVGESRTERSQLRNKHLAFGRLTKSAKFKVWMSKRVWEITSKETIEQKVEKSMCESNLKIEML